MRGIIAPSVLACDLAHLGKSVRMVERAGADWHHVDVMHGHFVDNLTFGPDIVKAVRASSSLTIDTHLMIEDPALFAERFIEAGSNIITFHVEVVKDPRALVKKIRRLGARPGLVLRPRTPVRDVVPFLKDVDLVLVMTVEPGYTGQKFMPECLPKVAELRSIAGPRLDIEVDGGLNTDTIPETVKAGANVIVAGAAIYRTRSPKRAVRCIREILEEQLASSGEKRPATR